MPVATAAAMKGLTPAQIRGTGSQIILNNAYHLFLRPGGDRIERLGGTHRLMRWNGPIQGAVMHQAGFEKFQV